MNSNNMRIVIFQKLSYKNEAKINRHDLNMPVTKFEHVICQVAPAKASFKEVGVGEVDWVKGSNIHKPQKLNRNGKMTSPGCQTRWRYRFIILLMEETLHHLGCIPWK